jgi:uncharacterized protein with GYD domain
MVKYVVLVNWTEKGGENVKETIKRAEQVQQAAERLGGTMDLLWTMGRYDIVGIADMPSEEAFATLAMQVAQSGATRSESLRAFSAEEMTGILQQLT